MTDNPVDSPSLPPLGELEIAVLEYVWRAPDVSAKQVHADLGGERGISANTVQSTLERLFRKEILIREKHGHAFQYRARISRENLLAGLINDVLGRFGSDRSSSLAAFVEAAEHLDEDALNALEQEIKARRSRTLVSNNSPDGKAADKNTGTKKIPLTTPTKGA